MGLFDFFKKKKSPETPVNLEKSEPVEKLEPAPEVDTCETAEALPVQEVPVETPAARRYREKCEAYQQMVNSIVAVPVVVAETPAPKLTVSSVSELTFSNITKKTAYEKLGNFVALDVETTGLSVASCEIIDVAAIRFRNYVPVEKFSTLLSTKKPIPPEATKINGITDEMVVGYPRFQQIAISLLDFIGDDPLVGHNLPFDLKFIVKYGADVTTTKRKYYDTLMLAQKTLKKAKYKWDKELQFYDQDLSGNYDVVDYKLGTLCFYWGILNPESHRAEGDALAAGLVFERLARKRTGLSDI